MVLLAPGAAIIAGAASLAFVLALYVLKLRRRPRRVASVLHWARAERDVEVNTPFRRLRPSWLLALHLLIAGLLSAALGRPAFEGSAGLGRWTVLLIDRSASMSVRDEPGGATRLERAKARARALARSMRSSHDAQAAVVVFGAEASVACSFTRSPAPLLDAIDRVQQSDQPDDAPAALRVAGAMLARVGDERGTRILLLSDGVIGAARAAAEAALPVELDRSGPAGAAPPNAGLVGLGVERLHGDPAQVRVFVRVAVNSASPLVLPLVLSLDGDPIEHRAVELAPAAGARAAERTEIFTLSTRGGGVLGVSIARPDALAADDSVFAFVPPAAPLRILLVAPDAPDQRPAADEVLRTVLEELRPGSLTEVTAARYERHAAEGLDADVVVFDRVSPTVPPPAPTLSFGAGLAAPGLRADGVADEPTLPLIWARSHPVLRDVALDALLVARGVRWSEECAGACEELARGAHGSLIRLNAAPPRRLVVAFALGDSNWPLQAGFPIFVAGAIDHLTLRAEARAGRWSDIRSPVAVPAGDAAKEVFLHGPSEARARTTGDGIARPGFLDRAGVYRVEGGRDPVACVNLLDETETSLSPTFLSEAIPAIAASRSTGRRELARWLVLAAGALLAAEWLIFARSARVRG